MICGAALILRVALIIATPHFALVYDSADYELHAARISLGLGFPPSQLATINSPSAFRPPAYPYLLGGIYALFGVHPDVGRLAAALLGTATVLLTALLGAALWDRRTGLWAGSVAAVFPALIVLSGSLLSESLFVPLELASGLAVLALTRRSPSVRLTVSAGALCAVAALTRTNGIVLLVPTLCAIAVNSAPWRVRAKGALSALLACILVLAPWAVRNTEAFGQFVPLNTQTGVTLAGVYNAEAGQDDALEGIWRAFPDQTPDLDRDVSALYRRHGGVNEAQLDGKLTGEALTYIGNHPGYFLAVNGLNALRMFDLGKGHTYTTDRSFEEMNVPGGLRDWTITSLQVVTLIALIGLVGRLRQHARRPSLGRTVYWMVPALAYLATIPAEGSVRYGEIIDPFVILIATATVLSVRLPSRFRTVPGVTGTQRLTRASIRQ